LLPLPEIDWKVESLYGYPLKCFLDAYKGYHQIQFIESDEEKMAFHTGQKSHIKAEMLRDIGETFWIKPCPDKTEAVLQISSPRTIKEVQSFNGKLASFNRFLPKSEKKSLSLFKTLKKCIKKNDFHWTLEVEQAFKQLKAISSVLMTEKRTIQTPVYFVSRALQGLELNYTSMEKLVLSLVFSAKRLQRMITKMERHAGRTYYHIPAKDVGERIGPSGFPRRNAEQKSVVKGKTRKGQNRNITGQKRDQTGSVEKPGNVKVKSQSRKQKKRRNTN
nr:hypothetical protein [Tanacetum cinerariifolium]